MSLVRRTFLKTGRPGWIRTINLRCQRPAFRWLNYGAMASVAGLAPARVCLKGRALGLLCIHGLNCVGRKLVPGVGIAPTSPRLQRSANLSQLPGGEEMVVRRGNAPRSSGYQPGALLLSYRTGKRLAEGVGNAPTSAFADPVFETGAASLYLPAFLNWLPGLDSHQHRAV